MNNRVIDIKGQKFNRWTVISYVGHRKHTKSKPAMWLCKCECGTEKVVPGPTLRNGSAKSCGCLKKDNQLAINRKIAKVKFQQHPAGYIYLSPTLIMDLYPNAVVPKGKKMLEHRVAMSNYLSRALYKNETVHHRNGNRADNRIENLELKVGNHGAGQSIPDLIAWAKEILRRYDK